MIRLFTRAKVSHTFLLLEGDATFGDVVIEAAWCGWRLSTRDAITRGTTRIVALLDPPVPLDGALRTALRWLDEPYNYTGLLGMAWVSVGRWLGKKWRNPLRNSRSMFCSEAVTYVLQAAGWGSDWDPQSTSPEDLYEALGGDAAAYGRAIGAGR